MIVDAWIQHPTPTMLAEGGRLFGPLFRWTGQRALAEVPTAFTSQALAAAKVDVAIATAWVGPRGPLISNDEVFALTQLGADPTHATGARPSTHTTQATRIVGAASVDLSRPMDAVRELRRCVNELGFVALRMLPWLWELPPDDRRYYPLYAACIELGVPFCLQVGHTGPLASSEPGRPIPYLERVCLDFPELVIVAGHIGAPWVDDMIFLARKFEGVHIDTSAYRPSRFPPQLVAYMGSRSGRKKVLFGSNHPMLTPASCLAEVDSLGLDPEARALFLGGNAARIFPRVAPTAFDATEHPGSARPSAVIAPANPTSGDPS